MRVFLHGAAATPTPLVEALCGRMDLEGVLLYHLHTQGPAPFAEPGVEERVRSVSFFAGAAVRTAIAEGRADFIPVFLSDIPGLFRSRAIPLDAAIVQVSPPDRHGVCSLGTSVDAARAAVDEAGMVIAEINVRMPRTHGAATLPLARIDAFVATDRPLHESVIEPETPETARTMPFLVWNETRRLLTSRSGMRRAWPVPGRRAMALRQASCHRNDGTGKFRETARQGFRAAALWAKGF
jgi:acyl-CoA hydrolase